MIQIAIIFSFYIIGAFATTDILRLLKGSSVPVSEPGCFCPACNHKIPLRDQIPIFSYLFRHGKCRYCGAKIPASDFCLEVFLFSALSFTALISGFSYSGLFICILLYQTVKFVCLCRFGRQETNFRKNMLLSAFHNLIIFGLLAFLFLLKHIVS